MATHVDVGERPRGASAEGVLDLMGTVKEWTADWYSVDAFARGDAADPGGPATGTQRVLRGLQGGFLDGVYGARRMGWSPGRTQTEVGFRCATGRAPIPDPLPHSSEVAWKVRDVAVGEVHTCAVNPQGAAWCWGNNRFGQLGDPEAARSARPVRVGLDGVQAIAAGPLTACASTSDRTVCWGELAEDSALGFDEVTPWEGPAAESLTLDSHVCLTLGPARILACAGANQDSQLGRGTVAGAYAPNEPLLPVGQLEGVVTAAAGGSHTCAVDGDGALWCWGDNGTGQLGLEGDAPRAAPTRVSWEELYALQAPIAELVAGSQHTCARLTDGTVRCWGRGSYGALGRTWPARDDGSLGPLTMGKPVPVEQIDDATALAAGYDHTCAIRPARRRHARQPRLPRPGPRPEGRARGERRAPQHLRRDPRGPVVLGRQRRGPARRRQPPLAQRADSGPAAMTRAQWAT